MKSTMRWMFIPATVLMFICGGVLKEELTIWYQHLSMVMPADELHLSIFKVAFCILIVFFVIAVYLIENSHDDGKK